MPGLSYPRLGVDFGRGSSPATFDQATLPVGVQLGSIYEQDGNLYRVVQFNSGTGAVASFVNALAVWKTRASFIVTMDYTDAESVHQSGAGYFLKSSITTGNYCFVQIGGILTLASVPASTAVGDILTSNTTSGTDGLPVRTAAGTAPVALPVAFALTAVTGAAGVGGAGTSTIRFVPGNLII